MSGLDDIMKKFLGMVQEEDYSSWVQAGTLTTEENTMRRENDRLKDQVNRELEIMQLKANRMSLECEERRHTLWAGIHKTHSLPSDTNYHLTDDGKILMKPKGKSA